MTRARLSGDGFMTLGVAPVPQTVRATIRYHVGHGLAMGYPLREVLAFAWRNRRSFERSLDRPDEQALRDAWADGYEWAHKHGATASLIARLWRYAAFPESRPKDPGKLFEPPLNDEELAILNDAMSAYPQVTSGNYAAGVIVPSGDTHLVSEHGPEIIRPEDRGE